MLAQYLQRLSFEYVKERTKPFAGSKFGNFVPQDLAVEAKKQISLWPYDITVKASVGAGNWAAVPWLAFFNPLETDSATRGFYVVYLVNAQDNTLYLSLNQGTTAAYTEFGNSRGREVLRRRAIDLADRVSEYAKYFSRDAIELGSEEALPLGYIAGHAFGKKYQAEKLNNAELLVDLKKMLEAYELLIKRGGTTPLDVMQELSGSADIEETRRYTLSRRIERSPKVRAAVLASKYPVCECCGLDPARDFGYRGPASNTPLDVHHARALMDLQEGESKLYKVPDDFFVLCPTCHRMIHKQDDHGDLKALKSKLRFKIMREIEYPTL
jgi:5-methylcytosine-specific restriction protein A